MTAMPPDYLRGGKAKPFGGNLRVSEGAKIIIGGRRVRMNPDGTYSHFTETPADKAKAERRKKAKQAKQSRKANRGR